MVKNRVWRAGGRESDEQRLQLYTFRVRRNEGLRRASNYTLVMAVLFALCGAALGLFPEFKKVERLREEVEALGAVRDGVLGERDYLSKTLDLLEAEDLDFVEWNARKRNWNLQAPGEMLLRIPSHLRERENRGPDGEEAVKDVETAP